MSFIKFIVERKPALKKPIPDVWVIRVLLFLVILLALIAGFYQTQFRLSEIRYQELIEKYDNLIEVESYQTTL